MNKTAPTTVITNVRETNSPAGYSFAMSSGNPRVYLDKVMM